MTNDTQVSGEERLRARRAKFWKTILVFIGIGAVAGFVTGLATGLAGKDNTMMPSLALLGVIAGNIGLVVTSIWFYRSVDELEIADNLWASMIGFYVYAAALPSWWVLVEAGITPAINHWAIYIASLAAATIVYLWRKLANR